ncbi:MAG: hypothetical protein NVS2B15_26830 [Pseudarthrobacter sp.]
MFAGIADFTGKLTSYVPVCTKIAAARRHCSSCTGHGGIGCRAAGARGGRGSARWVPFVAGRGAGQAKRGRHKRDIGALAAQSYKTGGTSMGFFVALDAMQTDSIHGLDIVRIVSDKTALLVHKSAESERVSAALAEQERAARAERERLAGVAQAKLSSAQSAQQAMSDQVAKQQRHSQELNAQLASLKGTTAAVEDEFRQGQAAQTAYEASQTAKRAAAEEQALRRQADAGVRAAAQNPPNAVPQNPELRNLAPQNPAPGATAPVRPAEGPTPGGGIGVVVPSVPIALVDQRLQVEHDVGVTAAERDADLGQLLP